MAAADAGGAGVSPGVAGAVPGGTGARGPGVGLWIGLGAGAAIVAGTVVFLVVFFTRPEPPALGWHDAPFGL